MKGIVPVDIELLQKSRILRISFDDANIYDFSYEFLRVFSPSAEVRGHSPQGSVLQIDKVDVGITSVDLVGNYALKINFDDGHDTGLYTWSYFQKLGANKEKMWDEYLNRLLKEGYNRDNWIARVGK